MALPTTRRWLDEEERRLGRRLPGLLRNRLLRANGGTLTCDGDDWWLHPVLDETDRKTLQRSASHIARETAYARERPGFPAGAVSIGSDGNLDLLVLLPGDDAIYYWDHETDECTPVDEIEW